MPSWSIAPLTSPDEIDEIIAIEARSFTNPWTREMYLNELQNQGVAHFLLARADDGRLVGFCSFWHVLDELHVNNLAVLPEFRRQGVASALLGRLAAEGAARGVVRTLLEVRRSNQAALELYRKAGFEVAAVREKYYSKPTEDALVLQRRD